MDAQRLSGQVRSIIRRNVFNLAEIERIKASKQNIGELQTEIPNEPEVPSGRKSTENRRKSYIPERRSSILPNYTDTNYEAVFHNIDLSYRGIGLEERPRISRIPSDQKSKEFCRKINNIVKPLMDDSGNLEETFCAAATICEILKIKPASNITKEHSSPPWEKRLIRKIDNTRKQIGTLYAFLKPKTPPSKKLKHKILQLAKNEKIKPSNPRYLQLLEEHLEKLRQKLKAYANRLKRYRNRTKRYQENLLFTKNQKQFYRQLSTAGNQVNNTRPQRQNMFAYWSDIWSVGVQLEDRAFWIQEENDKWANVQPMENIQIRTDDITHGLKTIKNWAAPGPDGIHNFWWKQITSSHNALARQFSESLIKPACIPEFFTRGITIMLPKTGDLQEPKNYRPITCLPTAYKILTSIMTKKIGEYVSQHQIMARRT
ncbi:uncharacterized protein LOC115887411 [Sitophilus oryzae]|uniref:Uncharacterized protein LOC115887411 n=1 Tax=Sitophilus oryzae TaxID=7048 RepID=A0A6J2YHT7_SITOR|nr:uncharacterized protein LOC115887411 [Sitophilus oryzae]